MFHFLNLSQC